MQTKPDNTPTYVMMLCFAVLVGVIGAGDALDDPTAGGKIAFAFWGAIGAGIGWVVDAAWAKPQREKLEEARRDREVQQDLIQHLHDREDR